MKKVMLTICGLIWSVFTSAQRGTDWDEDPPVDFSVFSNDRFILIVILIFAVGGLILGIVEKIKEKKKLASGEIIEAVRNGCIILSPSTKDLQPYQVIQIWKMKDFEEAFGKFTYNTVKELHYTRLISITCTKGQETVDILCEGRDVNAQSYFNDSNKYRVVKVKNGKYLLCRKW